MKAPYRRSSLYESDRPKSYYESNRYFWATRPIA